MIATRRFSWRCGSHDIALELDEAGEGPTVLLLPALNSISTRREMDGLIGELAPYFRVIAVDWPGFGSRPKPKLDWTPDLLSDYLEFVMRRIAPRPYAIIAAGHAATYVFDYLAAHPSDTRRVVSIAPTWRGPFPTMTGEDKRWFATLRGLVDAPGIGALLYALNLSRPMIGRMTKRHVYSNPGWLDDKRLEQKLAVVRAPGARHASVRFVTGALDRVRRRADFLDLARDLGAPHLVVYGEQTPRKSKAEMEALLALPGIEGVVFRKGKLSIHEEFAFKVGQAILTHLLPYRDARPEPAKGQVEAGGRTTRAA